MVSMENIKLVVTDLDGTFIDPQVGVPEAARATARRLKEKGIVFTFITGRPPYAVERFAKAVELDAPTIHCNGAILYQNGETVYAHSFPLVGLKSVLKASADHGLTVLYFTDDTEYALSETWWTKKREADGRPVEIRMPSEQEWAWLKAQKVNIMGRGPEDGFPLFQDDIMDLKDEYAISVYQGSGCEIVARGVNKAVGLKDLCQRLNISPAETLAIGDNENDIEMLKLAGIGAAVANASDSARASADYICQASYTDGVLEAIHKFVLKEPKI